MLTKGALVLQLFQIENTMRTILVLIVDNVPGLVGDVPVGLSHVCCLHVLRVRRAVALNTRIITNKRLHGTTATWF